jgi:hypothetical protein
MESRPGCVPDQEMVTGLCIGLLASRASFKRERAAMPRERNRADVVRHELAAERRTGIGHARAVLRILELNARQRQSKSASSALDRYRLLVERRKRDEL